MSMLVRSFRPAREVGTMPPQAGRVKRTWANSPARQADRSANAYVCLSLEGRGEARSGRGRIDRTDEDGQGVRRDRRELRAPISEHDAQMEPEHGSTHRGVDGEVPDVVPRRHREAAGERGAE